MNVKFLEMKVSSIAVLLAALAAGSVAARTVTVASCDRSTGATVLSISAAEAGDGAKALVAAWSPSDVGNAVTNARETVYVGAVAAAETEKSFTIPSAWRAKAGFVRFYLMADVPPYDTRLESLQVPSAGAYIDTGFVPNTNSDIRVKAYHPGDMAPFGVSGKCYLFCNSPVSYATANYFFGFFGASGNTSAAPRGTAPHVHKINAKGAYVDGICYYAFDPASLTTTTTSTLTLFARKNDSNTTVGKQGECTIYWAQLRQNGTLEHDYVPCVKDGVATLYDRAQGAFCTVKGNGAFTAGAEITLPMAILLSVVATFSACGTSGVAGGSLLLVPLGCSLFGISNDVAMQVVGVGFIVSVIQDSLETALNSSSDVIFTATAEFLERKKEGKELPI